jgi:NAD+ dependent glucose-6-phosphate dehydrogenase
LAQKVLVTGAEGTIGTSLRRALRNRYELVLLTRTRQEFTSHVADIADLDAIEPAFAGVDAVVHLAASAAVDSSWEEVVHNNVIGTYNVFEAARRAGADRVVFASSNHVVGMYEVEGAPEIYELTDRRVYDHRVELRPDSLYGVSKAFGEVLGRYYHERHSLRVFCLRIGAVVPDEDQVAGGGHEQGVDGAVRTRLRAVWQSQRDCVQLIASCLEANDVSWAIAYGISNNPRQFWDISHARSVLGYSPRDAAPV